MSDKNKEENGDKPQIFKIRHSLSHVLAQAIQHLYDDVKLGIGPAIDNGFYYDFIFPESITDEDLPRIEAEMRKILNESYVFERSFMKKEEAEEYFYKMNQPFKAELVAGLEDAEVGFYKDGDFTDLCKGPHVNSLNEINPDAFKLSHIAGAYWRGDEKRPMMQRIYGLAFETQEELEEYLLAQEEAKKRDHRKLGKQLDLFTFSELVGSGLPLLTPRGTYLRDQLLKYSEELQQSIGFERVWIPHITKIELYKVSGHYDKYPERFTVTSTESDDTFMMKPMNCPHHYQIYASQKRSYRDLPIRYFESTTNYRDEKAGELLGLSRVRSLTQDDGHAMCREDQVEEEFTKILEIVKQMYAALGMKFRVRLSYRDPNEPEKYLGDEEDWKKAEEMLEKVAKKLELEHYVGVGEAAFYGPKMDIMVTDALGREWQCATEQIDYVMPKRFGLAYTDKDGTEKVPVVIHKALLGSIERFLSVYIEHTAGNFPLWLCYTHAVVIPISSEKHGEYASQFAKDLKEMGIRVELNDDNETLGNKIRKAQEKKVPYMFIIGDKEMETNTVAVRTRTGANLGMMKLEEVSERLKKEIENKS